MATYYVGAGGNDLNDGLTWATRLLTLNAAEDAHGGGTPKPAIAAGDSVYVGPGVYRETLTCDISGLAGQPITYVADVTGEHTDGVGGVVRITGTDNDLVAVRANAISATNINYRTFRGFFLDGCSSSVIRDADNCSNWIVEDCVIYDALVTAIAVQGTSYSWIIRRCVLWGNGSTALVYFNGAINNSNHLVQNCTIVGGINSAIRIVSMGGISIRNCLITGSTIGVWINNPPAVGQTIVVNNCFIYSNTTGLLSANPGFLIENYNNIYGCGTARVNVVVGANSTAYPPAFQPPTLNSGVAQISGYQLPWTFGALSQWSQNRAITGTSEATEDLFGIARPVTAALNSWGPIQFQQQSFDTTTFPGLNTIKLATAGRQQYYIPVEAVNTTVTVLVQREANYAGTAPQMVLKQPGQVDITVTDAGGASAWNTLTHTWIPSATPGWVCIELVSNNTAGAGAFACYFRNMTASPLGQETMEAKFTDTQAINYVEEATLATAAFSPVGSDIVKG